MVLLSVTLSDLWTGYQGHDISWSRIWEKQHVLKTNLLLHKRKVYLTYGMVLCLVTLTDLQTRRACLSASAELLVIPMEHLWYNWSCMLYWVRNHGKSGDRMEWWRQPVLYIRKLTPVGERVGRPWWFTKAYNYLSYTPGGVKLLFYIYSFGRHRQIAW